MAAISSTLFALLLWGSIAGVGAVFCYELLVIGREAGWNDGREN